MATKMQRPHLDKTCSNCRVGKFVENPNTGEWYLQCNECGAMMFCYDPMPHQAQFHEDNHKFKAFFGGYGSAKTSTCAAEMLKLTLSTPNGTSLIGAATQAQLEQTAKKDFMSMLHPDLVANYSIQKNYIDLVNGHRILFRPLDQEGKARSLNLCYTWIEEASEVNYDYIVQLQTRLRNHATEHHQMILSSNPDLGHVRTEFLLKANKIYGSERKYHIAEEDKNPNISVHIAATHLNKYLPPDYYASTAQGKPKWWIERYLNASFDYAEGAVYSDFRDHIVKPFKIPDNWERVGGGDFGTRDFTVLLLGAIDPDTGIVYIYKEYYKNGMTVPQHTTGMKEMLEEIPYGGLRFLVGDPSGKKRNINDHRSLFDHYAEYGIHFRPGNNRIDAGIAKVQAYFGLNRLKIFENCVNTIREGLNYKYKPQDLDMTKAIDEKPMDGNDHACFIAGTLIETDKGQLPIESIKIGDKVNTRNGYKRVYDSSLTKKDAEVYKVTFSNGSYIVATGNHPVYVENKGFLPIDSLRYSDIIKVSENWSDNLCEKSKLILLNGTARNGEDTLNQNILAIEDISKNITNGFIEKFGNIITGIYQKGITSITKIMIQLIIALKTLNLLKRKNTLSTTQKSKTWILNTSKKEKKPLKELDQKQLIGISQKKDLNGTGITLKIQSLNNLKKLRQKFVSNAILNLRQLMLKLYSAPIIANPHGGEILVKMTRNEHVKFAEINFQSINTNPRKHVQKPVHLNLKRKHTKRHANIVQLFMKELNNRNIVKNNVRWHLEGFKELITYIKNVLSVKIATKQEKIQNQKHALEHVVINIEKLKTLHDVYNISVEEAHEYYANGILVHNCDSLRYLVNELPDNPENLKTIAAKPYKSGTTSDENLPFALQDSKEPKLDANSWYSDYY